jgi:hypothetical protein
MEAQQPAEHELREKLAKVCELIDESRDNCNELASIEDDLRQMLAYGQVSQLHFEIQLARLRKAHAANREHVQVLTHSRKALIYELSKSA